MKEQMKSQLIEEKKEMYFPEYALIDSAEINQSGNNGGTTQIDSSVIFG